MVAPARAGPRPVKSSPIGTRCGWPIRPECSKARACSTPTPTTSPGPRSSKFSRTTSSWSCSPAPSAGAAISSAVEKIKDILPEHQNRLRRAARHHRSRQGPQRVRSHRLRLPPRVRLLRRRVRQRQAARRDPRHQLPRRTARSCTIPTARRSRTSTRLPWVTDVYKRDLDVTKYNVPFLLHPFVALYSTRGCPAQCTFCLWPQTTQRPRLAQALHR